MPHLGTGKLRALAVTTAKRWYALPNVPTVAETLPGYAVELWFGAMAPKGTPQPILDRINGALNKALQQPEMKKNLEQQGMIPAGGSQQQFQERIRKEYDRWVKLVADAHLKPE
jgi:tripartite-type tricarboxylate transporter receptor subunit TctC